MSTVEIITNQLHELNNKLLALRFSALVEKKRLGIVPDDLAKEIRELEDTIELIRERLDLLQPFIL